ncbi:choice-of-anchor P family protein [Catenulispora yoronensis]|uniref:choice-of-anchor P family protein n=1 Tax=Catenulispora yoronensis TaxID=450799 RepID=UPI0031D68D60
MVAGALALVALGAPVPVGAASVEPGAAVAVAGAAGPSGLGGWTLSASAAPFTMEIYDPKIPIPAMPGKPNLEFDFSYTRASFGSGPTGASTASWLWPGDAIAFGLGQFLNDPNVKYPVLTNVQFPGQTPDATMQPIPGSYMQSHSGSDGARSVSTFGLPLPGTGPGAGPATGPGTPTSSGAPGVGGGLLGGGLLGGVLPQPQLPDLGTMVKFLTGQAALVDVQGERSESSATVTGNKAVATAESDAGKVLILGGLIEFDGLKVTSQSTSDGAKGAATGNVDYGSMSVAGVPFGVTANGIQTPFGMIALPQLPDAMNQVLAPLGVTVTMPAASDVSKDTAGEMFSHGMQISIDTAVLKRMLPFTPVLKQLIAQVPAQVTQQLPPQLSQVIGILPDLAPRVVVTVGSAKSKADASGVVDVSGGGGTTVGSSSGVAGTSGAAGTTGTAGASGSTGSVGSSGGSTSGSGVSGGVSGSAGSVGGGTTSAGGSTSAVGGSTVGDSTVGGVSGGAVSGSAGVSGGTSGGLVPSPPMQASAEKVGPAAFGGLPGQLVVGGFVAACGVAWALRKYSTLLFGGAGAGCELGHGSGVPDLREVDGD